MAAPHFDPGRVVQVYAPGRPAGERNVGAMRRHAATPAGDLPARVRGFADEPGAARFAPVHLVLGEYGERAQDGERLPMDPVRADTLAA
ncbi:MAG TPA: hypothetical protein VK904_07660, partial [Miltoncostaeaceae bacterium]|nr:hypothetical protein [Miltoncostaeaceae bacterium]